MTGQVLFLRQPYGRMRELVPSPDLSRLAPQYDDVLVVHPETAWISPSLPLICVAQGRFFQLLKVVATDHPLSADERRGQC